MYNILQNKYFYIKNASNLNVFNIPTCLTGIYKIHLTVLFVICKIFENYIIFGFKE